MKKLLLIGMLMFSGLAHAAASDPTDQEYRAFWKALNSADAVQVTECITGNKKLAKEVLWYKNKPNECNQFKVILDAKSAAGKSDSQILTFEALILADYEVTQADFKSCFFEKHKAILEALTKMVAVAKNEGCVKAIIEQEATDDHAHFTPEFKKELLGNLIGVYPALLEQEYLIETLLVKDANDQIVQDLVNQGAKVSETAKGICKDTIDPVTNAAVKNPRAKFLKKYITKAAESLSGESASKVIGVCALVIGAFLVWKNYKKEIKAFFFGDEDEEEIV